MKMEMTLAAAALLGNIEALDVNRHYSSLAQSTDYKYPFGQHTYNDIRAQELKCLANRNYEWHYDAESNTGSCTQNNLTPYKPYEAENDIRAQSSSAAELSIKNGWVYPFGQNAYNDIRA